jgi:hypothetical protein
VIRCRVGRDAVSITIAGSSQSTDVVDAETYRPIQ